jgi:comEA protein
VSPLSERSDWTRTPAAIFASGLLALASIGGLGWSIGRSVENDSQTRELINETELVQNSSGLEPRTGQSNARQSRSPQRSSLSAIKLIDVNSANLAQLDLLPGIGPALASRIIADRDEHGRYDSVEDLQRVSGIGPKTVEKLRSHVSLGNLIRTDESDQSPASDGEGG